MEAVVERIGGCCSTEAESKMCKLFSFGRNLFRTNASYDNQSSHYYRCFGGCYSTGTESGEWRLFWRELEYAIILWLSLKHKCSSSLFWEGLETVALLDLNLNRGGFILIFCAFFLFRWFIFYFLVYYYIMESSVRFLFEMFRN
uniref:Transmembrane protein n=1 Tax=Strongyloides stercoralis TaxID=6248 RepID=A0A0K0EAG9_STRER